jgi:hypothetical protein
MRLAALTLISSLALATVPAAVNAAPSAPGVPAPTSANLVQVSGGCGPAFHRNPWGYCAPNYYGYGYGYAGWYNNRPYNWGYRHPRWRHHHRHH